MTTETDCGGAGRDVIHVRYGLVLNEVKARAGDKPQKH